MWKATLRKWIPTKVETIFWDCFFKLNYNRAYFRRSRWCWSILYLPPPLWIEDIIVGMYLCTSFLLRNKTVRALIYCPFTFIQFKGALSAESIFKFWDFEFIRKFSPSAHSWLWVRFPRIEHCIVGEEKCGNVWSRLLWNYREKSGDYQIPSSPSMQCKCKP